MSRANSVMPMIPFIGVRISWLILARNSLLARLPASAASLARFSASSLARSLVVRWTTFRSMPALVASNWAVRMGDFLQFSRALNATADQNHVFEHHPTGMFQPAPPDRRQHSVHGLRPPGAAKT